MDLKELAKKDKITGRRAQKLILKSRETTISRRKIGQVFELPDGTRYVTRPDGSLRRM